MEAIPNWWAVIVAAIVKFVIGAAWYAPQVFGKQWQAEIGMTQEQVRANLAPSLAAEIITDLVMAIVLACFIGLAAKTLLQGAMVGLAMWVGFVATVSIAQVFYEKKSWRLWSINNGYLVISLVVMGAIMGAWQ